MKKHDFDNRSYESITDIMLINDEFHNLQNRLSDMNRLRTNRDFLNPPGLRSDRRRSDSGTYLITISPPPESQNQLFITAVHEFVNLAVVRRAMYVFEQRSAIEGEYHGIHCHILCDRNVKPSAFKKSLDNKFKKFFRETFSKKQFNLENVEITERPKVIRYIRGEKNGGAKKNKALNDKNFRRDWNLEDLYEVDKTKDRA